MNKGTKQYEIGTFAGANDGASFMLLPAVLLMAAAISSIILVTFGFSDNSIPIERPYLIPWVLATGVTFAIPMVLLYRRNEFRFTNPLVFPLIMYFTTAFFIGGWSLTFGLSNYFYLNYVTDPTYNFPLAFVYIMVGFASLSIGYFIAKGKTIGDRVFSYLPTWDFSPAELVLSCSVFLVAGYSLSLLALEVGQVGYQMGDIVYGATGSLIYFLTMTLPASTFLLWIAFFRLEKWSYLHLIILVAQFTTLVFMLMISGGKGSLLHFAVMAIGAFVLTRDKVRLKHWMIFAVIVVISVIAGTIYGTKFRDIKGTSNRVSVEEYSAIAVESLGSVGSENPLVQLRDSFFLLADRLETVSALAVVVSNYEALATYEASYGIENNIWTYTWTAFVPRFLWKDKPIVSDGAAYNDLYFDNPGFGLSLTVMGDLLRNFGPVGVPLGMILVGFGIRIFYASLVEGKPFSAWRAALYFVVLTQISYDSFYGTILQNVVRVTFVIGIQIVIMRVIIRLFSRVRPG